MKKTILSLLVAALCNISAFAQLGIFNHVGVDVNVGTTGIGFEVSTPITSWVQARAGMSFMPGISFNTDFDITLEKNGISQTGSVDLTGDLARTQGSLIFNVYPFGQVNSLFVAVGAYFGGKSLVKLNGYSQDVKDGYANGTITESYVEVGDYKLNFEQDGNIYGGLISKNFRPYLGIGYGRPCPGKRLGFMVELGVQFMGKMKVAQGKDLQPLDLSDLGNDDDWQKVMDKLTVYPVLRFTLCGKII